MSAKKEPVIPPANPLWERTKPAVSKDGKAVTIDAMVLTELDQLYRFLGVRPVPAKDRP